MKTDAEVAYFCMEFGIEGLPLGGGLGILAGDFIKSCADLKLPVVGVGLLYSRGNFHQRLSDDGWQTEWYESFDPTGIMKLHPELKESVTVKIEGRNVALSAWQFNVSSSVPNHDYSVPIIYLDTTGKNKDRPWDQNICSELYPGEHPYFRLAQEQVLGTGGVRMLDELGFKNVIKYHLNEGHAALSGLELMNKFQSLEEAAKHIIYTTHTPVPAGIEVFPRFLADQVLNNDIPSQEEMFKLTGSGDLNMMRLAMAVSSEAFGVSKLHAKVSKVLFKDYPRMDRLYNIDNGIHLPTWTSPGVQMLYDKLTNGGWRTDRRMLEKVLELSDEEVLNVHNESRNVLAEFLKNDIHIKGSAVYNPDKLTIGFARRSATYKQATLIFDQIDRLRKLGKDIQIIFAGKAHPSDLPGKQVIQNIFEYMKELKNDVAIWFIGDYDMKVAKYMVRGVDLWLNNPMKLLEASGTSGMKAAANLIPQMSVVDGWWYPQEPGKGYTLPHGLVEGVTGWGIGNIPTEDEIRLLLSPETSKQSREKERWEHSQSLHDKLEHIVGLYKTDKKSWAKVMKGAAAHNASYFNTHRMAGEYFEKVYRIGLG